MPVCYLTHVLLPLKEAYVLDVTVANRELRRLREQVAILERFCDDLATRDAVKITDPVTGATRERYDSRLVSATMARALGSTFPELKLFISWAEAKKNRVERSAQMKDHPPVRRYLDPADAPEPGNEK